MSSLPQPEKEGLKPHLWENSIVKRNILILHWGIIHHQVTVVVWNHIGITANKRSSLSMENHVNSLAKVFAYQDKYILLGKIAWEITSDWNDKKVTSFCWLIIHIPHWSSYWHDSRLNLPRVAAFHYSLFFWGLAYWELTLSITKQSGNLVKNFSCFKKSEEHCTLFKKYIQY